MKKTKVTAACTIYHNPRCSKSRAALALLEERKLAPAVIEYLKSPPTASDLKKLLKQLGMRAHDIVRTSEPDYESKIAGLKLSESQLLGVLAENPILIERPIVVVNERAAIGRPTENILQLLK